MLLQANATPSFLLLWESSSSIFIVAIYVNDVLVAGNDIEDIIKLKTYLNDKFQIKDTGLLLYTFGNWVQQNWRWYGCSSKKIY